MSGLMHNCQHAWLAVALVVLAGCSSSSARAVTEVTATPSAVPSATATPATSATPPPTPTIGVQPCAATWGSPASTRAGDLLIRMESFNASGLSPYAYAKAKLPDGTPLKPLQIQDGGSTSGVSLPLDPPTNPRMDVGGGTQPGGYVVDVCNASATHTHKLQSVTVRIDALSAYSAALSEWDWSCHPSYDALTGQSLGGGCGGGPYTPCETMRATFAASAGAGASVTAAQVRSGRDLGPGADSVDRYNCLQLGPLPVSLPPGQALDINIGVVVPSTPGTYTFAFGVAIDSVAPAFVSAIPMVFAPVVHEWDGAACGAAAMRSQIPPASTHTYYICPES